MLKAKKDFQKVIKEIRGSERRYPKPMMTGVQMEKRQATVNCGGEWFSYEETLKVAQEVMETNIFKDFLESHNATARIERGQLDCAQIRIQF